MYIGPWQEYNLSKARTFGSAELQQASLGGTIGVSDVAVRSQIEKALLSSLDPESAKKALEAMNPILSQNLGIAMANPATLQLPAQLMRSLPRKPQRNPSRQGNRRSLRRYRLPPVESSHPYVRLDNDAMKGLEPAIRSARNSIETASPLSVRSTQSEPIKSSDQNRLAGRSPAGSRQHTPLRDGSNKPSATNRHLRVQLPRLHGLSGNTATAATALMQTPSDVQFSGEFNLLSNGAVGMRDRQPPYNAHAAVNLLRLERSDRTKAEIARITGWTMKVGADEDYNEADLVKPTNPVDRKVEKVNMMKKLYMTQHLEQKIAAEAAETSFQGKSPLTGTLPPLSPQINAADSPITRNDSRERHFRKSFGRTISEFGNENFHGSSKEHSTARDPSPRGGDSAGNEDGDVQNMNLTDADFGQVMKYFRSSLGEGNDPLLGVTQSEQSSETISAIHKVKREFASTVEVGDNQGSQKRSSSLVGRLRSDVQSTMDDELDDLEEPFVSDQQKPLDIKTGGDNESIADGQISTMPSPYHSIGMHDELHVGGLDGLLKWSSSLDVDNI